MKRLFRAAPAILFFLCAALLAPACLDAAVKKKRRSPAKRAAAVKPSTKKAKPPVVDPTPSPVVEAPPKPKRERKPRGSARSRIRRIRVVRRDIFDTRLPDEDKKIFRLVNSLHFSTKESAIRAQMLLKEGDIYNADLAKESERAIRGILRLRNVKVTPVPIGGGTVDVLVTTQETWTTEPVFSATGVGSNLNLKAGLRERNVLGYGKRGSYFYRKTDGIISRELTYEDPAVLGTPLVMDGEYEDREDGSVRAISLAKPFRSSITPWSLSGDYTDDKREVKSLDNLGVEVAKLLQETRTAGATLGVSAWSTTRRVRRPMVGYRRLQERSSVISGTATATADLYHIFNAGFQWEHVNFLTVDHIDQYDRDEDFALGPALTFTGGAARKDWNRQSKNANFFKGEFTKGRTLGPSHFGLFKMTGDAKYQKERWRAATITADTNYYNHFQPRQTLALHLGYAAIVNPGPTDQILLGGDTGLRAYKINQFAGNKKLVANAENRFFIIDDVLRIMSMGAVVFADAGYVWGAGKNIRMKDVKADFGTGLRFYLNRTSVGHVLRLDLAYAAKRVQDQERIVLSFGSEHAF